MELRVIIERYIRSIEKFLKEAMEEGAIVKGEPSFMVYTFMGALCSTAVYELINENREDINQVIENLIIYILKGIEK